MGRSAQDTGTENSVTENSVAGESPEDGEGQPHGGIHEIPFDLRECFEQSLHTDFTIKVTGETIGAAVEFKVHRVILCAQSEYFKNMFDGEEIENNEMEVHEEPPYAIEAMIRFMYGFKGVLDKPVPGEYIPATTRLPTIFAAAVKYGVYKLGEEICQRFWDAVVYCDYGNIRPMIRAVYGLTASRVRDLRDIVIVVFRERMHELTWEGFLDQASDCSEFTFEMMKELAGYDAGLERHVCPGCEARWEIRRERESGRQYHCISCGEQYTVGEFNREFEEAHEFQVGPWYLEKEPWRYRCEPSLGYLRDA
ncbi:hypothetical protein FQN54_000458 [Arachnomyces sp. PD_36]|nr:hypothetical protein FQN54_000458 [Arachnomyces sp. PD_36]